MSGSQPSPAYPIPLSAQSITSQASTSQASVAKNAQPELHDDDEYDMESDVDGQDRIDLDDVINEPSTTLMTLRDLHVMIHQGDVDLSPPYQRDVVWTDAKQSALCGSLIRNYYVPPILFQRTRIEDGIEILICMDGKQRLTSIQKFIDGQIPIQIRKGKYWFTASMLRSKSRLLLSEELKEQFLNKTLSCVKYEHLQPSVERDIFQRVQLGVPLSTAEKLQALSTPWSDWLAELDQKHIRSQTGLTSVVNWDIRRGRNFLCLVQLLYCCDHLPQRSEPTAQKVEKWLKSRTGPPTPTYRKQVDEVLNTFWLIGSSAKLNKAFTQVKQIIAPVEFVFIGILLAVLLGISEEVVAEEALHLRRRVRSIHNDVRANNRVYATMWDLITEARTRHSKSALSWVASSDELEDELKPFVGDRKGKRKVEVDSDYRGPASSSPRKTRKTMKTSP